MQEFEKVQGAISTMRKRSREIVREINAIGESDQVGTPEAEEKVAALSKEFEECRARLAILYKGLQPLQAADAAMKKVAKKMAGKNIQAHISEAIALVETMNGGKDEPE